MESTELKFLLKLLDCTGYRTPLSQIKLNNKTPVSERNKVCHNLRDRGLVACTDEVINLKIAPPGKTLLKLGVAELPVTPDELKVLKKSAKAKITPGLTNIPPANRGAVIQSLAGRGLIQVETKVNEVWLTEQGQEYLRNEYEPSGSATISLNLLNNYLRFFRKSIHAKLDGFAPQKLLLTDSGNSPLSKPGDEEILQVIRDLDHELGTENYLPIFHLRQKLQPPLTRDELDQALYYLQRNDQIELSSLQEAVAYTPEQIEAGIPQEIGGPLFFVAVN